jgi:fused signal recognition particle receptor
VSATEYLAIIVGVLVVLVGGGTALLVGRRRRTLPPPRRPAEPPAPGVGRAPGVGGVGEDVEAPPSSPTTTVEPVELPEEPILVEEPPSAATAPAIERPEPVEGRLTRLRARLSRSNTAIGQGLFALLSRDRLDESTWEEIEETLIIADVGVEPATEIVERLRRDVGVHGVRSPDEVRSMLRDQLLAALEPDRDRSLAVARHEGLPAVVLVVGVNGTGKTTTVGKLARVLVAEDKDVVLGAADTFRAAAADQLQTWGERVGVITVRSDREGADPASVAFAAVQAGIEGEADVVVVDTAGRLHTKVGLMDELGKVKRVIEKQAPVGETLLVLDATTGQNGLQQARVFSEVVDVTGIVLTKLDGTAKGGIVVAVQKALGVPVKLVGLGEGPDDLAPFEPAAFVDALLN